MNWSNPNSIMQPRQTKKNKKSDPTSPSRLNTFQPCIIVTSDHFWHHAIKQFSLYLLFKNFTCTHCLLLTMRLWLSLFAGTDSQLQGGALDSWPSLNFLVLYFEGGFIIYIPQKYKIIPNIYIYIYTHFQKKKKIYIYIHTSQGCLP